MGEKKHTIGTDPEFFIRRKEDGKMISAIGIVDGTKDRPKIMKCGCGLQFDNVALEFATPVAESPEQLLGKLKEAFTELKAVIPKGHELAVVPCADFDEDQLDNEEAKRFGCSPDYCAWDVRINEPPEAEEFAFRSCGAHLHVGHKKGDGNDFLLNQFGKLHTIRMMDAFHGVISTILDNSPEALRRRNIYGKAGCHRPTPYGVEYRTLSSFWMKTPELVMLMCSLTEDVLAYMRKCKVKDITNFTPGPALIEEIGGEYIRQTINNGDAEEAAHIYHVYLLDHMSEDSRHYMDVCLEEMEKGEEKSLEEAWGIGG